MQITATIITFNEESNIKAACESVAWADEIVVVDSNSTDKTRDIAAACGARVIINEWPGFGAQKHFAVSRAEHDWIFSLDADERVSDQLRASIEDLKKTRKKDEADGWVVARRTYYQGRWIRGGGWYPDYQLRLFNRTKGQWKLRQVHESVVMETGARVGELAGDLLHYTSPNAAHHHTMIGERYAPLAARQTAGGGRRTTRLGVATGGAADCGRRWL